MAQQFNLTAQINLQSPKNVGRVVSDIQRQLKGSGLNTVNIKVKADPRSMAQTNRQLQNVSKNSRAAAKDINSLNRNLQEATRRFSVITLATGTLLSFVTGFKNATKAAIEFERELVKISQVTGKSVQQLQGLTKEVTRLSTAFGVSSADLLNVSRTLAQAGFNAEKTRKALDILAKTTLAATFDNIQDTTEGAIALLRQFGNEARSTGGDIQFLEKSLSAINSVSKQFAVESGDLITVIRRVGGVFSSAGGSINELIALFTSVRATTRESAETIATGLRTIFTRIQRVETIQQLKALNIQLQDSQGQFVGAFEAVRRLSQGLAGLSPRDFRFNQIVEQLGGFRQIGKVIPLIQQFTTAQEALNVAQNASGSVTQDAATAQQSLAVQIQKVREEFTALIRKFTDSGPFNTIATGALKIASAMIKVAEAVEPLLPLLTTMFGLKLGKSLAPGVASLAGIARGGGRTGGGGFSRFARGGMVPGQGNRDTVPAMLTPGEFVIKKSSVKSLGAGTLAAMNENRFNKGIRVTKTKNVSQKDVGAASDQALKDVLGRDLTPAARARVQNEQKRRQGNKTKRARLDDGMVGGLFLQSAISGSSKQSFTKTTEGMELPGKLKGIKSIEGDIYTGTLDKKANQAVRSALGPALEKSINTAAAQTMKSLEINPLDIDEKSAAKRAVNKIDLTSIEGFIFEAFISSMSGLNLADPGATFDFPNITKAGKKRLSNIFGPDPILGNLLDAKRTLNRETIQSGRSSIANKVIAAAKNGQIPQSAFKVRRNKGGGIAASDTVPALLTPGEFVFNKSAAQSIGYGNLNRMNKQGVQGFADGGAVGVQNFQEGGGVRGGLQSIDRAAGAAQSFIFLGAVVGSVTSQMSSLSDETKRAVNETAAFASGVIGITATVVQTFTSLFAANTAEVAASGEVVAAKKIEAGASLDSAKKGSNLGKAFGLATIGIGIALTALKFFSAKAKAEADKFGKGIDESLKLASEGGSTNAALLKKSAEGQAIALKKSSQLFSAGSATTVAGFAAAGAAIGSIIPVLGTGVGAAVGAIAGAATVYVNATGELTFAEKNRLDVVKQAIVATSELNEKQFKLSQAISDIDAAKGLDPETRVLRRLNAQQSFNTGSSAARQIDQVTRSIRFLGIDEGVAGTSVQDFANTESEEVAKRLFANLEAITKNLQTELQVSSKTLQEAIQTSDPSKTFEELTTDGGLLSIAFKENLNAIKANSEAEIKTAEIALRNAKGQEAITSAQKRYDTAIARSATLQSDVVDFVKKSIENRNTENAVIESSKRAQIALQQEILKTRGFFASLNERDIELERQARAISNFGAMLRGNTFDFSTPSVDELDDVKDVKDVVKFVSQLKEVSKGGGPVLTEFANRIASGAEVFRKAQEQLLGQNLQARENLDTGEILRGLGLTENVLGGGSVGAALFKKIEQILVAQVPEGELTGDIIEKILQPLADSLNIPIEAIKRTVSQGQKELQNYQAFLNQQNTLRQEETDYRKGIVDALSKTLEISERVAAINARVSGVEVDQVATSRTRQRIGTFQAQGDLDSLGLGLTAGNRAQVSAVRKRSAIELNELRIKERSNNLSNLEIARMAELQNIVKVTTQELKRLAAGAGEVDVLIAKFDKNARAIEREAAAREKIIGRLEEFVVGGPEERARQIQGERGAQQAFAAGTLQMQSPEQRQLTANFLRSMGDLPVAGGFSGEELLKELTIRDAQRMGRISPEQAKLLREGTTVEKQLIQANQDLKTEITKLTFAMLLAAKENVGIGNIVAAGGNATGGLIQYRAKGGTIFKPRGTDTVPAMLSPGEFVIRKSAVDSIGADTLSSINSGNYLHEGGRPHRHLGRGRNKRIVYEKTRFGMEMTSDPLDRSDLEGSTFMFTEGTLGPNIAGLEKQKKERIAGLEKQKKEREEERKRKKEQRQKANLRDISPSELQRQQRQQSVFQPFPSSNIYEESVEGTEIELKRKETSAQLAAGTFGRDQPAPELVGPTIPKEIATERRTRFDRLRKERRADIRRRRGIISRDERRDFGGGLQARQAKRFGADSGREEARAKGIAARQEAARQARGISGGDRDIQAATYQRILRTQGPAAAQRYSKTSGYTPPGIKKKQREPIDATDTTNKLLQMLIAQLMAGQLAGFNQGPRNRGGVMPIERKAAGGGVGGADVVPAMLTPGEFVMSAGAVRQHGVGVMRSLNKGQIPRFNRGGMVGGVQYRQNGGEVTSGGVSINTANLDESFSNFVANFSSELDKITGVFSPMAQALQNLANIFGGEEGIKMNHVHTVTIAAGSAETKLDSQTIDQIAKLAADYVKPLLPDGNDFNVA